MPSLSQIFPSRSLSLVRAKSLGGAPPRTISIPFVVAPQTQTQWCWAAVSSSVAAFFTPTTTWSECSVAAAEMVSSCCVTPGSTVCNQPHFLDAALTRVGHLRSAIAKHLLAPAVEAELLAGLPVGIRVQWRAGGGHFLSINGMTYFPAFVQLSLTDPWYGPSVIPGNALITGAYQSSGGRWTHSYAVKP